MLTVPFHWVGSKVRMRHNLSPIIYRARYSTYVEPFGGAGGMLFGLRHKNPNVAEIYNDTNSALVTFFKVLRDPEKLDEVVALSESTPYSRELWYEARDLVTAFFRGDEEKVEELLREQRLDKYDRDVALAFSLFYVQQTGFGGKFCGSWGTTSYPVPFGSKTKKTCREQVERFRRRTGRLYNYAERFRFVSVEHDSFTKIFKKYDCDSTLFYCDPPYSVAKTTNAGYKLDWTPKDDETLVELASTCNASIVVSCYDNEIYKTLLEKGFERQEFDALLTVGSSNDKHARECVYYKIRSEYIKNDKPKEKATNDDVRLDCSPCLLDFI